MFKGYEYKGYTIELVPDKKNMFTFKIWKIPDKIPNGVLVDEDYTPRSKSMARDEAEKRVDVIEMRANFQRRN